VLKDSRRIRVKRKLFIDPPVLLRWVPKEERDEVLFLELEPDFLDENTIRIDLNVVFRPIPIRRGSLQTKDYYVGSTGARVLFETFDGKVKDYTKGSALKVNYESSYSRSRESDAELSPEVGGKNASLSIGEVSFSRGVKRTFKTSFSGNERVLSDIDLGYGVEWELKLPRGQAIRDYLIGNLFLYVESSWDCKNKGGRIVLRPSDILFFDSERRTIGDGIRALAMRFVLWRQGIRLNSKSVAINFKEI
jgi:hypothetical protein